MRFIWFFVSVICFMLAGAGITYLYFDAAGMLYKKQYDGLDLRSRNHTAALKTAYEYDEYGNWVCVNVRNMDYGRAKEVCQHEVGHEIFASECEKNWTKCEEAFQ